MVEVRLGRKSVPLSQVGDGQKRKLVLNLRQHVARKHVVIWTMASRVCASRGIPGLLFSIFVLRTKRV